MTDDYGQKKAAAKTAAARKEQDRLTTNNRKKILKAQMEQPSYRFPLQHLMDYKEANGATATIEAMKTWEQEMPSGWVRTAMSKSRKALDRGQDDIWMSPLVFNSVKHTNLKDKIFENVGIPGADSVEAVASKLVDKGPQFLLQIQERVDGGLPSYDNDAVENYGNLPNWFVPTTTIDKEFTNQLSPQAQEMLFSLAPQQVREVVLQAKQVAASKGVSPEEAIQQVGAQVAAKMSNGNMMPPEDQISSTPIQQMDSSIVGAKSNLQDLGDQMRNSPELNGNMSLKAQAPRGSAVKLPTEPYNNGGKVLGAVQKVLSERSTYVPEVPAMSATPPMPQAYAEGGGVWNSFKSLFSNSEAEDPNAGYADYTPEQFLDEANNQTDRVDQVLSQAGSQGQPVANDWELYKDTVGGIESGNTYDIIGGYNDHYDGRYQMGLDAKKDAARILGIPVPSREEFRANPALQDKMFEAYTGLNHDVLTRLSPLFREMASAEQQQILGYAHNQGAGGAIDFLNTGESGKDGFGTAGTKYINAIAKAQSVSPAGGADAIARRNLEADVDRTSNDWIPLNESGARDNLSMFEQGLYDLNVPAMDERPIDVPMPTSRIGTVGFQDFSPRGDVRDQLAGIPAYSTGPDSYAEYGQSRMEVPPMVTQPVGPNSYAEYGQSRMEVPSMKVPPAQRVGTVGFQDLGPRGDVRDQLKGAPAYSVDPNSYVEYGQSRMEVPQMVKLPTDPNSYIEYGQTRMDVPSMEVPPAQRVGTVGFQDLGPRGDVRDQLQGATANSIDPNSYVEYGQSRMEVPPMDTPPVVDFTTMSAPEIRDYVDSGALSSREEQTAARTALRSLENGEAPRGTPSGSPIVYPNMAPQIVPPMVDTSTAPPMVDMSMTPPMVAPSIEETADAVTPQTDKPLRTVNAYEWALGVFQNPEATPQEIERARGIARKGATSKTITVGGKPALATNSVPAVAPSVLSDDIIASYKANATTPAKDIIRTGAKELGTISMTERREAVANGEVVATVNGRDIKQVGNAWVSVGANGKFRPASEAEIKGIQFANAGDNAGADVVVSANVQRSTFVDQWMTNNPGRTQGEAIDAYEDSTTEAAITSINTDPVNVEEVNASVASTNVSSTEVSANSTGNATVDSVIQSVTNSSNSVDDLMGNIEQKIAGLKKEHSAAWRKSVITGLIGYALVMGTGGSFAQAMQAAEFGMQIGGGDLDFVNKQLAIYEGAQGDALTAKLNAAIQKDFPEELTVEKQLNFAKRMLDSGEWDQATYDTYKGSLLGGAGGDSILDKKKARFATEQLASGEWTQAQHDDYLQKEFFGGTPTASDNLLANGWEGSDGKIYFDTAKVPEGVSIIGKAGTADSSIANPWVKAQVAALDEVKASDVQLAQITNVLTTIPDDPWGGVFGQAKKTYADLTGSQAAEDIWRTQVVGLTTSTAIASLPPGVASDKDIELVLRGQIDGFANPEAIRTFTKAAQRLSNYNKRYNTELSAYIQENRTAAGFVGPSYDPSGADNATIGTVNGGGNTTVDNGNTSVDLDLSDL